MTARVQVQIEAQDMASGVLRGITSQFGKFGTAISDGADAVALYNAVLKSKSPEEAAKANDMLNASLTRLAETAVVAVIEGIKDSLAVTAEYAESVRDLSMISGESAENTSRFLQVLDDYQLSAQDAEAATRKLTQNGLAPTIDTLASLSDRYLAINDAQERNKFIIDNLGRSGLQWVNVLNQGSAAIMAQGAAVSDSMILTEENITQTEEYRLALDEWNDTVMGAKVAVGLFVMELHGLLSVDEQLHNAKVALNEAEKTGGVIVANNAEAAAALRAAHEAEMSTVDSETMSYQAYAEALENTDAPMTDVLENSALFKDQMSTLKDILKGDLGKAQDDYNAKMVEYNNQLALAKSQKEKDEINANILAEKLAYDERATAIAFNIQQEAILNSQIPDPQKLEMITSLGQAYGMYDEATANAIMSTQGIISEVENGNMTYETAMLYLRGMKSGMLEVGKASNDISEPVMHLGTLAENSAAQFGAFKESQSEMAQGLQSEAAPAIATVQSKWQGLNSMPHELDYTVTITTVGSFPNHPGSTAGGGGHENKNQNMQVGGVVYAGGRTMVGERGMEPFFPRTDGRILGHAEAMNAMSQGGGSIGPFYGPVTLEISDNAGSGLMSMR